MKSSRDGGGPSKIAIARPRACATPASPDAGTMRRPRSAGPCAPACPRLGAYRRHRGLATIAVWCAGRSCRRLPLLVIALLGCGDDGALEPRAAPKPADRFDASTAAWRARWREPGRAGPAAGRLAHASRRLARAAAARSCRTGATRPCPAGCATSSGACPGAAAAASWSARTTTPRTSPASWAPTTARRARRSLIQLARTIKPRTLRRTVVFVALRRRGEPARQPRLEDFEQRGLRGSKVAAAGYRRRRAMVLLDFVGDRRPAHPARGPLERRALAQAARGGPDGGRRGASSRPRRRRRPRRPPPVPATQGVPVDRPDRLQLPLLAPALRRPVRGLRAQPRRRRRDRAAAARYTLKRCPERPREAAAGRPARLLRGRRPRRPDGRARARAVRRRRSTCARRSSTTSTWSSSSASAARSSWTRRPRCPRARRSCSRRTASRPACTPTPSSAA